jgi:formate transporter
MFFLPYALALSGFGDPQLLAGSVRNLLVVTGGNILGGTVLVAGVYWVAYLRPSAGADAGAVEEDNHA